MAGDVEFGAAQALMRGGGEDASIVRWADEVSVKLDNINYGTSAIFPLGNFENDDIGTIFESAKRALSNIVVGGDRELEMTLAKQFAEFKSSAKEVYSKKNQKEREEAAKLIAEDSTRWRGPKESTTTRTRAECVSLGSVFRCIFVFFTVASFGLNE